MAPLALPKKEFMERAQALWAKLDLPPITLKQPWHGYELGDWIERWDTWADARRAAGNGRRPAGRRSRASAPASSRKRRPARSRTKPVCLPIRHNNCTKFDGLILRPFPSVWRQRRGLRA